MRRLITILMLGGIVVAEAEVGTFAKVEVDEAFAPEGTRLLASGRLFSGKELIKDGGFSSYDFGARFLGEGVPVWNRPDPLCEQTPEFSPYAYCRCNPVMFIDPRGLSSYYYEKNKNLILLDEVDDGLTDNYIVLKPSLKRVLKAKKEGKHYSYDDVDSKHLLKLPSKEALDGITKDINRAETSGKEAGSHLTTDGEIHPWDLGCELRNNKNIATHSIQPFMINGKFKLNININITESYWHIHPQINGYGGYAKPSRKDFLWQKEMESYGYLGYGILYGSFEKLISIYNSNQVLTHFLLKELSRIYGME